MKNDVQLKLESALLHFSKGLEILDDLGLKSIKDRIELPVLDLDGYMTYTNPDHVLAVIKHWQPDPKSPEYDRCKEEGAVEDALAMTVLTHSLAQLEGSNNNDNNT
tara:strand:+ start:3976 stop:4293 length:318 start_codon:yes stop_codon:yes gene_type:complete